MVQTVRINKRSMRTTDSGLGLLPRACRECETPLDGRVDQVSVHGDSLQRINAYRVRRGWPELTSGDMTVRAKDAKVVGPGG
jgi:hypothetical protein